MMMKQKLSEKAYMNYRPDIDGLRAVAVLPVIAFHAHIAAFTGGFIGVDVFFVISGYLISSIILSEIDRGGFSVVSFYERRIRRIFPALLVTLFVTSIFACIYLLPLELEAYSKSMLAAIFSVSNFYFWSVSGYFDLTANQQPLVHTWSLAVEEQFYVFFPLFLVLSARFFPSKIRILIVSLAALSFVVSAIDVFYKPMIAFYFPHTRAWELLLGTILALNIIPQVRNRLLNDLASAVGLCMIIAAVFMFSKTTPFPGLAALVPCIGAGLIIHAGRDVKTMTSRLLSIRPLVFIGLISYSLYLWHWPLIFFQDNFSTFFEGLPTLVGKAILLSASIGLAALSWWFVERPFRSGVLRMPRRQLFVSFGAGVAAVSVAALSILALNGLPWRFSPEEVEAASYINYDPASAFRQGECFTLDPSDPGYDPAFSEFQTDPCLRQMSGRKNYLLLGDSLAADLWYGLSRSLVGVNLLQATGAGCKATLAESVSTEFRRRRCTKLMGYIFSDYLQKNKVDALLIAGNWYEADLPAVALTLDWAHSNGIKVVLFGPKIHYDAPLPRLMAAAIRGGDAYLPDRHRLSRFKNLDEKMGELARSKGVTYISYFDLLCKGNSCQFSDQQGHPLTFDTSHLTSWGSVVVAQKLEGVRFP